MPLGTPFIDDLVAVYTGGVISMVSASQLGTKFPGVTKTATKTFTLAYNGQIIQFTKGVPVVCDTALLAALAASGVESAYLLPTVTSGGSGDAANDFFLFAALAV